MSEMVTKRARSTAPALDLTNLMLPGDYPSHHAARAPGALAIVCGSRRWTYAELDRACDAFVTVLRDYGIGPGDRIAYHGKNSDLYFPVLFGAMRAGVVLVPVNWRNTAIETRHVLDDSGSKLIIVDAEFVSIVQAASEAVPILLVDDDAGADNLRVRLERTQPAERHPMQADATALQLYTSGTTGRPKGVLTTQFAIAAQRQAERESGHFDDWRDDETLFSPLPNFHIGGMSWALTAFVRGLPLIITADPSPPAILNAIIEHGATRSFMVPTLVRALIDEMQARGLERSSLRGIHYGAAAMDPHLLDRSVDTLGCRFLQYYGMTELGGSVTILGPTYHDTRRPHLLRSVGRPMPGFTIEIRSPDAEPVAVDTPGEIWIRGPSVTAGYWQRPEATAEALVDGWYRSGDGGRIDEDGFLYLTDRIKDMIVSGGENVYPAEVEAALREHPAVLDCAVFGLPHDKWGEGVTAAVEVRPNHSVTADALIAFARGHLAAYKIPRRIELDIVLPRTATGKVQRGALRATFAEKTRD
ncbi:AMP-binding protein [Sphingomonas aliaeris]|uniref:3-methylmercaptopropionyl-CoA ligase n=1 Tax=Sphingomonas aliaeris TaxID=2759526 RepID=A0A974S4K3_9SPHN|nr:AMP-binding protein [Sphingomonas aliaeris]QQV77667.1 AMP-binding protein [Sphingomonas aliaeris]